MAGAWYPDPFGRHDLRYHNGERWTGDVATAGVRGIDAPVWTVPASGDRAARTALILGLVGVCLAWLPFLVAVGGVASLAALIVSLRARARQVSPGPPALRLRTARILGLVGLLLVVPGVVLTRVVLDVFTPGPHTIAITDCTSSAGRAVLTGTVTNLSDESRGYLLLVRFSRSGTGGLVAEEAVQVDDVDPGDTESFAVSTATDVTSVACEVVEVLGALPIDVT